MKPPAEQLEADLADLARATRQCLARLHEARCVLEESAREVETIAVRVSMANRKVRAPPRRRAVKAK